jgi:dTMP kinase
MASRFITFEGGEGSGKSTQIRLLAERLKAAGITSVLTREPGGTPTAESIRRLLLSGAAQQLGVDGEAVLFAAARADHVERVIRPALAGGQWVLSDRFFDSTHVYQASADRAFLDALDRVAVGSTRPDLTLILDVSAQVGIARAAERIAAAGTEPDRFERDDIALHEERRQAFLEIAAAEPERCRVIDASRPEGEVAAAVWQAVQERLIQRQARQEGSWQPPTR